MEKLTKEEINYIIGLLKQKYNGLEKCEEYDGEYDKEKDLCNRLLKKLN